MSKPKPTPGIEERHARSCPAPQGSCRCTPTYRAQAYDAKAGRPIKRTFPTRSAAKQWRTGAMAALRAGDLSADRGPLLRDAVERWFCAMEAGQVANRSGDTFKPSAIRDYRQSMRLRVLPALGHLRIDEMTTRDVQLFVDGVVVAQGLAPATIDATLTALRAFYRRAASRGDVKANPCLRIEKPGVRTKDVRVVPAGVAATLLDALHSGDRALWATAFYAGLRRGELTALRPEDVDLASGFLRVERGWDIIKGEIAPKSRQGRRKVPIAAVLRDVLLERRMSTTDGRVFGTPSWIAKSNDRARERWTAAGLPVLTLHEARHTCASMMIAANVNLKAVSAYMGHANIGVTLDLYGHLLPGSETEAVSLFDAYLAREIGGSTVPQPVPHPAEVLY